ncbi:hypothetical protein MMC07_002619 [Pseudocyphellaria aurata]|nr:hypothetical protein [Pseudocyphellaria aurata]
MSSSKTLLRMLTLPAHSDHAAAVAGASNQAASGLQSNYALQQPPAPPPVHQQQHVPEQAFQRSLLSHHSAPQSMLSQLAEADMTHAHMAQEVQSWDQQGSLKGLTSQFHAPEHAAGNGYHSGGQGLLRHASAVAQLESLAGASHAAHGSMLPRIPSSQMVPSTYQPSNLQVSTRLLNTASFSCQQDLLAEGQVLPVNVSDGDCTLIRFHASVCRHKHRHLSDSEALWLKISAALQTLSQADLPPDAFSYFNNTQIHNTSLHAPPQGAFTEPRMPAVDAFLSQQPPQASAESMFGMSLGRNTASHQPPPAPFAIAPGAEMHAAKRNGLEQEALKAAGMPTEAASAHQISTEHLNVTASLMGCSTAISALLTRIMLRKHSATPSHCEVVRLQEFQSLPPRFSRQLSVDVLNGVLDFIRQVAVNNQSSPAAWAPVCSEDGLTTDLAGLRAGKQGWCVPAKQAHVINVRATAGITQLELEPLQLEASQATALINALLHLHRLRLNVSHGVTSYTLVQ